MPQIVNTNFASLNAQRNLNASQGANETALQRLSSGLRINSAKDDAAGLAISTRFQAQIRGTNVAVRNAGDAISLAQTAEGALNSIATNLQRIRELALQSANDTNTDVDRVALNEEVQQLKAEIENIATKTNFNGKKLLDGSFSNAVFQTGANVGDTIAVSIAAADSNSLGTARAAGISSVAVGSSGAALVAGDLVINGQAIAASTGVDDSFSFADNSESAIAKAAAINKESGVTGVTAQVNTNTVAGNGYANDTTTGTVTINGISVSLAINSTLSVTSNLNSVVDAINEKSAATGVIAEFSGSSTTGITLSAEDGRNISLANGTAGASADAFGLANSGTTAVTYVGSYTLISKDGTDIQVDTNTGDIDNAGLEIGTFSGQNSGVVSDNVTGTAFQTGDLVINGVAVGPTESSFDTASTAGSDSSAIAKAVSINKVSEQTGVTAVANANILEGGTITAGSTGGSIVLNGVSMSFTYATTATVSDIQNTVITTINNKAGQTGVSAEAFGNSFRLIAEDGRNIDLATATSASDAGFGSTFNGGLASAAAINTTFEGSLTLLGGGDIVLTTNTGNIDRSGFNVSTYGGGTQGQLIKDVDVSSVANAEKAVDAVDNALVSVASQRASLGAVQNRFDRTIANLSVTSENLTAANSRIQDADFAVETAELSRTQVLLQAGISVLAQANARPQLVLSLLQ